MQHPREVLYEDDWTWIARSKNKLAGRAITLERSLSLGHVETMLRVGGMVFGDSF